MKKEQRGRGWVVLGRGRGWVVLRRGRGWQKPCGKDEGRGRGWVILRGHVGDAGWYLDAVPQYYII